MVSTVLTYATIVQNTQSSVRNLLNADSTVTSLASRVLDGSATDVINKFSMFVLAHSPSVAEVNHTIGRYKKVRVSMDIDCIGKQESLVRQLVDAVRSCLETNFTTLNGDKLRRKKIISSTVGVVDIGTSDVKSRHIQILTVEFDWYGVN